MVRSESKGSGQSDAPPKSKGSDPSDAPDKFNFPGRFASDPTAGGATRLLQRARRTITYPDDEIVRVGARTSGNLPEKAFTTLQQFRTAVFRLLVERLKVHGILTDTLKEADFHWCMPTSLIDEEKWRVLFEDPFVVPTWWLEFMLVLEVNNADSPYPPPTSNNFYVRTFTFKVEDARAVFQAMLHDSWDSNPNIFAILERLELLNASEEVEVRYCGQVSGNKRPWERHLSDIYDKSLKTWFAQFLKTVGMIAVETLKTSQVHTVEKACSAVGLSDDVVDLREQTLIALFGDSVLNSEFGGKNMMILTKADQDAFDSLETNFLVPVEKLPFCPIPVLNTIKIYADSVMKYATTHPTTTTGSGRTKHKFSKATRDMLVTQGRPAVLSDQSAVMVSVGSDLGDTHKDKEEAFWYAGGRSADVVSTVYNHFGHWEQGVVQVSFNRALTRRLARKSCLPFTDVFPWPVKHEEDYLAASKFLRGYMGIVKPIVVLTYGHLPTYAARQNFAGFKKSEFVKGTTKLNSGTAFIDQVGYPEICAFSGGSKIAVGQECVIIPSFHPGFLGYSGVTKEQVSRVFVLTSAIAWKAASLAIQLDQDHIPRTRKQTCREIIQILKADLEVTTVFGQTFHQAKQDYVLASKAFRQGSLAHTTGHAIKKPPTGILAAKSVSGRGGKRIRGEGQTTEFFDDGFEVVIHGVDDYSVGDNKTSIRHSLHWKEEDGQAWSLSPIILPSQVVKNVPKKGKTFILHYSSGGLDIHDNDGVSQGTRKATLTGNTKLETLPIASLIMTLGETRGSDLFFEHWEEITGSKIEEVLYSILPRHLPTVGSLAKPGEYYPASFFQDSRSKRILPFSSSGKSTKGDINGLIFVANKHLPANPGDLLWLIDRFFQSVVIPGGGTMDLFYPSIHPTINSVYTLIAAFCAQGTYRHHPHLRTFLAFANMSEMGEDERMMSNNALMTAAGVLTGSYTEKKVTKNVEINGKKESPSRKILTLGEDIPSNVVREDEPEQLEQDVVPGDDVTDDEMSESDSEDASGTGGISRGMKRSREGDEETKASSSRTPKRKAQRGPVVEESDDDDMLFDNPPVESL